MTSPFDAAPPHARASFDPQRRDSRRWSEQAMSRTCGARQREWCLELRCMHPMIELARTRECARVRARVSDVSSLGVSSACRVRLMGSGPAAAGQPRGVLCPSRSPSPRRGCGLACARCRENSDLTIYKLHESFMPFAPRHVSATAHTHTRITPYPRWVPPPRQMRMPRRSRRSPRSPAPRS